MFSTAEILLESYNQAEHREQWVGRFLDNWNNRNRTLTLSDIRVRLDSMRDEIMAHDLGKGPRPWALVDLSRRLDPKQNWIGVEFETGFEDRDDYEAVASFVWDNTLHSTLDSEGSSCFPVEITFAPVNQEDFESKNYEVDKLLKFMRQKAHAAYEHYEDDQIGTHVNISTPSYRQPNTNRYEISQILNNSLGLMDHDSVLVLFGRSPYGGFYANHSLSGSYIEGKLFNSTQDEKVWKHYKAVMINIAGVIEELASRSLAKSLPVYASPITSDDDEDEDNEYDDPWDYEDALYITNLDRILMGQDALDAMEFSYGREDALCLSD